MCVQAFDEQPHLQLLKEMLTHAFATPKRHPKSKPFLDHVINFSVAEGRIWLRNYQVHWGTGSLMSTCWKRCASGTLHLL
jgi:hypothetical protein